MTPRIVQTWKTENLAAANPIFSISKQSWQSHHPDWDYDFFTDETINVYVKSHFPNYYRRVFSKYQGQIERVDAFRIITLFLEGGVYCDLDGECLKPLDSIITKEGVVLGQLINSESRNKYSNAWMCSTKEKEEFWLFVLAEATKRHQKNRGYSSTEYLTGPILITDCVQAYQNLEREKIHSHISSFITDNYSAADKKSSIHILEPEIIYPVDWSLLTQESRHEILQNRIKTGNPPEQVTSSSHCIHYWTHSWTRPNYSIPKKLVLRIKYLWNVLFIHSKS